MIKKILLIITTTVILFGGTDYSELSTQELLAIVGYETENKSNKAVLKELKTRVPEMNTKEKSNFTKKLKKHEK